MNPQEKPNGIVVRTLSEDGGSYVFLYKLIGERVIGFGESMGQAVYGTLPLDNMVFVQYNKTKSDYWVTDLMNLKLKDNVVNLMKKQEFIPLVEELFLTHFDPL